MRPEYSGLGGSQITGEDHKHEENANGGTSNNTSMDNYSSVKEFNPATNEILQLKPFDRDGGMTARKSDDASSIDDHTSKATNLKISSLRTTTNKLDDKKNDLVASVGSAAEFGTSSVQMKSLLKSFSNGNF
jgi:hypothetical protein